MVCYYLRVSQNRNNVLLVELKDTPGVVDRDRMLGENGCTTESWLAVPFF